MASTEVGIAPAERKKSRLWEFTDGRFFLQLRPAETFLASDLLPLILALPVVFDPLAIRNSFSVNGLRRMPLACYRIFTMS